MAGDYIARFLEVLNHTFTACDDNGSGFVEINKLINFLISQEPSWVDDKMIRDELHKVLNGDLNYMISKEDFINSLHGWFESSQCLEKEGCIEENDNNEAGKYSSSTSGIDEPSEISSGSSTNSVEEIYLTKNLDEQTYTNEDFTDEMSLNDSGSSQADSRLVKALQSEVSTLLRKNEYLENVNDSLLGQLSCLEDIFAKKKEESEDYKTQLIQTKKRLEIQLQKHEETEYRINLLNEDNKSMTIQLSQSERETSKLKNMISNLEKKLENTVNEKMQSNTKLEDMKNKFNKVNDLYNNSVEILEQEREQFKLKEKERENVWKEIVEENKSLHFQLDSNTSYTEDINCKLRGALKELSHIKSAKMKSVMKTDVSSSLLSADNSMVFFDENFSLDTTIPFETSLLAELKDEVQSEKQECCCVCKQSVTLASKSSDVAVSTDTTETEEKATMTMLLPNLQNCSLCSNVEHKNVGVGCSYKNISGELAHSKSSILYTLKTRKSFKKWVSLIAVLLFLCVLLMFFCLSPSNRHSHKPMFSSTTVFDLLHIEVESLELLRPIK